MNFTFGRVYSDSINPTSDHIIVGDAFAFLKPELLETVAMRWLRNLLKRSDVEGGMIIPLVGHRTVNLPEASIEKATFPKLLLRSITADKMLYQSNRDVVNLLVYDPVNSMRAQLLVIRKNGNEYEQRRIALGRNGEAHFQLRDLSPGQYSVHFSSEVNPSLYCDFTVAEYKLVPLVAEMVSQEADSEGNFQAKVKLESFGTAVDGTVKVQVLDGSARIFSGASQCTQGILSTEFKLQGAGPHQISFQLADDGMKTASVPIVGSRQSERSTTLFSPLGVEINGSLLPTADCEEVRGIFLSEGAMRSTPIAFKGVKDGRAEFEVRQDFQSLMIAAVNPLHPVASRGSINPDANHPSERDPQYVKAEELFKAGEFRHSLSVFEECSNSSDVTHPYYEYFKACCHAHLGNKDSAIKSLRNAILNGWRDYDHMETDPDLSALWDEPDFQILCAGGVRHEKFARLTAGQKISIEVFTPACVIVLGGFTGQAAWEGWTCAISRERMDCNIKLDGECQPGKELKVVVANLPALASVYCIVKDARLICTDTPKSRLASSIKNYVEQVGAEFKVGSCDKLLTGLFPREVYPTAGAFSGGWGAAPQMMPDARGPLYGAPAGSAFAMMRTTVETEALPPPTESGSNHVRIMSAPSSLPRAREEDAFEMIESSPNRGGMVASSAPALKAVSSMHAAEQPEVLYAGFLKAADGVASVIVQLPDSFANYVVECFIASSNDWQLLKNSFRAEKSNFVDLNLPLFSSITDSSRGSVHARSESVNSSIVLRRNGEVVETIEACSGQRMTVKGFSVLPGDYRAELVDGNGQILDVCEKRVQEPGKLRHEVQALRMLSAGESITLDKADGIKLLSLLPGLDTTFDVMVDATADYGHACCEQTAAKILSACAMYLFAGGGDDDKRSKAESIILAGIKRESSMWIKGSGFKMYPEQSGVNPQWSVMAVRHLWHLCSLQGLVTAGKLSKQLEEAVRTGLLIAADVGRAQKMEFPPAKLASAQDAYLCMRFGEDASQKEKAISYVRDLVANGTLENSGPAGSHVFYGQGVLKRQQSAFAAAVLLQSKQLTDNRKAIELADQVTKELNEHGRLYSTVDSAAAIALLSELRQAQFGSKGKAEINGSVSAIDEALSSGVVINSLKVLEGVVAAQVTRVIEEDWSRLASTADISVKLVKDKTIQRKFKLTDQADLVVTIGGGYKDGDLLWVCLPEALSRVYGGGQIKVFSMDFVGNSELTIPLAATGRTVGFGSEGEVGQQHMAVCLRNMFDEERCGNPGLIPVTVS